MKQYIKKFDIFCLIRKANPARRMAKGTKEHRTCPNELQHNLKQGRAGKVLLTDITYLTYVNGKRAYLSTIKDAETNEILACEVSSSLSIDIALNTPRKMKKPPPSNGRRIYSFRSRIRLYESPIPENCEENDFRSIDITPWKLLG